MVAQHLVDAGFERVLVLKGGMKAWSKFYIQSKSET